MAAAAGVSSSQQQQQIPNENNLDENSEPTSANVTGCIVVLLLRFSRPIFIC